jgi:uncharacterized damage-inducible protein DinB
MNGVTISRPAADEATPYFHGYISEVPGENIVEQMTRQMAEVEELYGPVEDARGREPYAPGKWSPKEVLGHLSDTERIFAYRLLRFARGDRTPLSSFDENAYVPAGQFNERTVRSLLEEFKAVRQSTLALVQSLSQQRWTERGTASGNVMSTRALAYIITGHVNHHVRVLRERYGLGRRSEGAVR